MDSLFNAERARQVHVQQTSDNVTTLLILINVMFTRGVHYFLT